MNVCIKATLQCVKGTLQCTFTKKTDHNDDGDLKYTFKSFHVTKSEHEEINMFVARCNYAFVKSAIAIYIIRI